MKGTSGIAKASNPGGALAVGAEAMSLERTTPGASLIEILERVLGKGIVLDASPRVSQVRIDPMTNDAPIVVVPIQTYLK